MGRSNKESMRLQSTAVFLAVMVQLWKMRSGANTTAASFEANIVMRRYSDIISVAHWLHFGVAACAQPGLKRLNRSPDT